MKKTTSIQLIAFTIACLIILSCNNENKPATQQIAVLPPATGISRVDWGTKDGKNVYLYTLTNTNGIRVTISNYGGTITSWMVPDKNGVARNIVLGFDSLSGYLAQPPYFGATIGRYGNRIGDAQFTIGKKTYKLAANNGKNHLHGGLKGFDKIVWEAAPLLDSVPALQLSYLSKDGEEGYPGNLKVTVTFTLTNDNTLQIGYDAETDQPTPVNLTNHSYFNLSGDVKNTILNHKLVIFADNYLPVDTSLIPTGELRPVKGTPFDFTSPHHIGERIDAVKGGYDHNFVLTRQDSSLHPAAILSDSASGRKLEVFTTEPGLQFYSGNFLNGRFNTPSGDPIKQHDALCLETQHFPDSPNQPKFPNTILQPGQHYHSLTQYRFSLF